jgi:hypothetical protein
MRKTILIAGLLLVPFVSAYSDDATMTAFDTYKNHYGPVWEENAWDKIDEAVSYYDDILYVHSTDGSVLSVNVPEWMVELIEGWKADGWVGSSVADLQADQLNETTVSFKSKWLDWYEDGTKEYSCAWYLADLKDGRWVFTNYADIDCAEHDLDD